MKNPEKRTENRIEALKLLYEMEMTGKSLDEVLKNKDELELNDTILEYVKKATECDEEIVSIIEANLKNYRLNRLNKLDVVILKGAVAEMLIGKTPHAIIINEALNISRAFTQTEDFDSVKFNNSVLDKISKSLKN